MSPATEGLLVRALEPDDCVRLAAGFAAIGWNKPVALFEAYLRDQADGDRRVAVAEWRGSPTGYVTVSWLSSDRVLRERGIPEIQDLNVFPRFRRRGIGAALMDDAEAAIATRFTTAGLRVGLHAGYGSAQRLYVRRGFVPDGAGAIIDGDSVPQGAPILLDDAVTIRMLKVLRTP